MSGSAYLFLLFSEKKSSLKQPADSAPCEPFGSAVWWMAFSICCFIPLNTAWFINLIPLHVPGRVPGDSGSLQILRTPTFFLFFLSANGAGAGQSYAWSPQAGSLGCWKSKSHSTPWAKCRLKPCLKTHLMLKAP